jgi:chloramphenicol 3-O phosphotransferase
VENGRVILLNGTSSSGKTTIAMALQEKLLPPFMYVSIDNFFHLYPEKLLNPTTQEEVEIISALVPSVISGMQRCVAALAQSGNNVLVDHVLQEEKWLKECVDTWTGLEVFFVGVKCPLEITEKREKERGDRTIGTARYQFKRVHAHHLYDIELDTSLLTVQECVTRVIDLLQNKPEELAFQKINSKSRN